MRAYRIPITVELPTEDWEWQLYRAPGSRAAARRLTAALRKALANLFDSVAPTEFLTLVSTMVRHSIPNYVDAVEAADLITRAASRVRAYPALKEKS